MALEAVVETSPNVQSQRTALDKAALIRAYTFMLMSRRMDEKLLTMLKQGDTLTGGFGAELAAIIAGDAFQYLDAPVRRVAAKDSPVPYSPPLEYAMLPQEADISKALQELAQF